MKEAQGIVAATQPETMKDMDSLSIIRKWQLIFKREALQKKDELQGKTNVPILLCGFIIMKGFRITLK